MVEDEVGSAADFGSTDFGGRMGARSAADFGGRISVEVGSAADFGSTDFGGRIW